MEKGMVSHSVNLLAMSQQSGYQEGTWLAKEGSGEYNCKGKIFFSFIINNSLYA